MSPTEPLGYLFNRAPEPITEIIYKFLAPVLSAQFNNAPVGSPHEILYFVPVLPPLPKYFNKLIIYFFTSFTHLNFYTNK